MKQSFRVTGSVSQDGELLQIRSKGADGSEGSAIIEVNDLPQFIALLARLAADAQKAKGSTEIPFFPAQAMKVHQKPAGEQVLVTLEVDPGFELTFGLDKSSLQGAISELNTFLEDGSGGTKSSRIH